MKRRLTDEERDLASAATGHIPWDTTDAQVARWRQIVADRQARRRGGAAAADTTGDA